MRIMSFAKLWDKLKNPLFATFRYPRTDKDWSVGERVSVFIKNRSPARIFCGIAEVVGKEVRNVPNRIFYNSFYFLGVFYRV
jgi:hypothetical protein